MPLVPPMPTLREIDGPAAFFDIADKQEALDELKRAVDVAIDWCAKGGTVLASPATTSNASEHTPHADQVGASESASDSPGSKPRWRDWAIGLESGDK